MAIEHSPTGNTLGLILAGGNSSRMGVDKASLMLGGMSFLQLAMKRFELIGIDKYLVSSNSIPGAIADRLQQKGPLAALDAVLNRSVQLAGFDSLLVVPIDLPLFPTDSLQQLCLQGREHNSACFYASQPMPFFSMLNNKFSDSLTTQIESNNRSIGAFLARLKAIEIEYSGSQPSEDSFYNVNTPENLRKVEQKFQKLT